MEEKEIGLRIAKLRTKRNVSAREMSLSIGQNESYINHIETGNGLPSIMGLSYICDYLNITMSEFFDYENTNPVKLKSLTTYLKKLNDEQLEAVEKLVKSIAEK